MIQKLHKNPSISNKIEPIKGEREVLCSNETNGRSPFLDCNTKSGNQSEDMQLEYLAELLVDIYMSEIYEWEQQESSNLCPGVNERTG